MINIRHGNDELHHEFYGYIPRIIRSLIVMDDQILLIAGLKKENDKLVMFSDITDEIRKIEGFKKIVLKVSNELKTWIPEDVAVFAVSTENTDLLSHMGFEYLEGDVWAH